MTERKSLAENVDYVLLHFVDLLGLLKGRTIPEKEVKDVISHGIGFDGSSIPGFVDIHESDMIMKPDLSTFMILPETFYGRRVGRVICNIFKPGGKRFERDSRFIVESLEKKLEKKGLKALAAAELEFYVVLVNNGSIIPVEGHVTDHQRYFDISPGRDMTEEFRMDLTDVLSHVGFDVERHHHEVGPGQSEITFKYDSPLRTSDNIITYKFLTRIIAHNRGWASSFMPKIWPDKPGNGMHVHISLSDKNTKKNLFSDLSQYAGLSQMCRYFIGGILSHAKALSAILSPTVNSYKRLVPGYEAPVVIVWSRKNRSAFIRVPEYFPGRECEARIEVRSPDTLCNPYLCYTVLIEAGMDGIKKKIEPGDPLDCNVYKIDGTKLKGLKIETLPKTQKEALEEWESDDVCVKALGKETANMFRELMLHHWENYTKYITQNGSDINTTQVTEWEIGKYLYA